MQEQILTKLRDIQDKLSRFSADITHGELTLFGIKPKLEKIIKLYIYCFENGDIDLLNEGSLSSLDNDLGHLLEAINNLEGEHHRLENIVNLTNNAFVQFVPQLVSATFDDKSFKEQLDKAKTYSTEAEENVKKLKTFIKTSESIIEKTVKSSQDLLDRAATGALADHIDKELKSVWNKVLMGVYIVIAVGSFRWLLCFANDVKYALINQQGFNFEALVISWLAKLPIAALLVFVVFQLRSRIKYIDILRYRKSVALSLQSEIQLIFDRAVEVKNKDSADKVRLTAIELLVEIIKEFATTPTVSSKQEAGIGVSKLASISVKDENS